MCDYSLYTYPNRLAETGETLVTSRCLTGSMGFRSAADVKDGSAPVFVCIPPGAKLELTGIPPRLQESLGVAPVEEVTFTQLELEGSCYRDAVQFGNGRQLLLQHLDERQSAVVLSLDGARERKPGSDYEAARVGTRLEYA